MLPDKELRQEILSYLFLFPFPPISQSLAFRLAILIFAKTRFCSHIYFIGRCLHSKVIPKGFRSNFHASSLSHCNQYLRQIQCAQNSFSRNIMRITIRAMCQKRDDLNKQILQCRSELFKICPAILVSPRVHPCVVPLPNIFYVIEVRGANGVNS